MSIGHSFPHAECRHYINEYYIGFRVVSPRKGETYEGKNFKFHSIVFLLEGKLQFSYDDYLNRSFEKGDMFFTPQASDIYGVALEDSQLLVLTFDTHIDSLCSACSLTNYIKVRQPIEYDFKPLRMPPLLWSFTELMQDYIDRDMRCAFIHQLKQKELFVLLQYCYTEEELLGLFMPALGEMSFKSWVLENYNPDQTMEMLAGKYNMTPKSFSRKFKTAFGVTFRKWTLRQKAKHIKLRLSMPGTTFNDILRDFKFTDMHYFYNFCKEQYGCTATELLAQLRDKNPES